MLRGLLPLFPILTLLAWADLPSRRPFPGQTRVSLTIRTPEGKATGLRLRVTDAAGAYFPPLGHASIAENRRSAGDVLFGDGKTSPFELAALVYDGAQIDLPPGSYKFAARKGFEYEPVDMQVSIGTALEQTVTLPLRKFADFEARVGIRATRTCIFPIHPASATKWNARG